MTALPNWRLENILYLCLKWIFLDTAIWVILRGWNKCQKQPSIDIPIKRCSENMQQIYRRTPMRKCDFNKVAKHFYWNHTSAWVFSCMFAAYFQTLFPKNTSGGLLLKCAAKCHLPTKTSLCDNYVRLKRIFDNTGYFNFLSAVLPSIYSIV